MLKEDAATVTGTEALDDSSCENEYRKWAYPVSGDATTKSTPPFTPSAGNLWGAPGVRDDGTMIVVKENTETRANQARFWPYSAIASHITGGLIW